MSLPSIIKFFLNAVFMCFGDISTFFLSVFPPYLQSARIEYCIDPGT